MRPIGYNEEYAAIVDRAGEIDRNGKRVAQVAELIYYSSASVSNRGEGVRPAMWIDIGA